LWYCESSSGSTRRIGDFTRWKEHDTYQKALDRLLRDLWVEKTEPVRAARSQQRLSRSRGGGERPLADRSP
jgi:hypothetical protein